MFETNKERWTAQLFTNTLTAEEIEQLLKIPLNQLVNLVVSCGHQLLVQEVPAGIFQSNYETIIQAQSRRERNPVTNNFALHFINIFSYACIKSQKIGEAKELLKLAWNYTYGDRPDPTLLSIALNNLSELQFVRGKYFKALRAAIEALQIMGRHLHGLHLQRKKKQQIETSVVFVSILILSKKVLSYIIPKNRKKFYTDLYKFINYLGTKYSNKFLGRQSLFAKKFPELEQEFFLPMFRTKHSHRNSREDHQAEIMKHLTEINEALKAKKEQVESEPLAKVSNRNQATQQLPVKIESTIPVMREQPAIFIQDSVIENQKPVLESKRQPELPIQKQPQTQKQSADSCVHQLQLHNSVQSPVEIQLSPSASSSVSKTTSQQVSKDYSVISQLAVCVGQHKVKLTLKRQNPKDIFGDLHIKFLRNSTTAEDKQIAEESLQKIMSLLSLEDCTPYEQLDELPIGEKLLQQRIIPYLTVGEDSSVGISPKCRGLVSPFFYRFKQQDTIFFLNHVREDQLRLSISPKFTSSSLFLNLELCEGTLNKHFARTRTVDQSQNNFFYIDHSKNRKEHKVYSTRYQTIDEAQTHFYLQTLIEKFSQFLESIEQQVSLPEILSATKHYYKYHEAEEGKGRFYFVRYLSGLHAFDIFLQNDYNTYCPGAMAKARGNCIYHARNFFTDFGILSKVVHSKFMACCEIIVRKYKLTVYDRPLTERQYDKYAENAVVELPITQNYFLRELCPYGEYSCPITLSIVSINSQIPVGVKVSKYDPIICKSTGYFIFVNPAQWLKSQREPKPAILTKMDNNVNNITANTSANVSTVLKKLVIDYDIKTRYFLPRWMEQVGFHLLMKCVNDEHHQLSLAQNQSKLLPKRYLQLLWRSEDDN